MPAQLEGDEFLGNLLVDMHDDVGLVLLFGDEDIAQAGDLDIALALL